LITVLFLKESSFCPAKDQLVISIWSKLNMAFRQVGLKFRFVGELWAGRTEGLQLNGFMVEWQRIAEPFNHRAI